jgi:hypothetical protein
VRPLTPLPLAGEGRGERRCAVNALQKWLTMPGAWEVSPCARPSTRSTPRRISASMVLSVRVGLIAGMIIIFFISGLRYYEDQQDGAKNTRCDYANDVVQ